MPGQMTLKEAASVYKQWKSQGLSGTTLTIATDILAAAMAEQITKTMDSATVKTLAKQGWDKVSA